MAADLVATLNEIGESILLDGVETPMIIDPVDLAPGEFERLLVERKRLWLLAADDNEKVPGEIITLGSDAWLVVSADVQGAARTLTVERGVG